ncbi:hypothetical protein VFPPC_02142 [Pochonia chlamydosporia 170]|uniref:Uncharacterized protein n=1 Tax=Pochonia chlamydosporia 170 TaxID=1380566 RepID=A0A179F6U5_METCM|nr:hypothetical protein VFPPC_02142 [Pochonia chlamydosporia 170]OAQ61132.1 hypothetical protein VFPPC_02142 [Pochonia chlamydosporia 170]
MLQQLAGDLSHNTLPFDKILCIGSELGSHLETIASCNRCVATKRKIHILSQTTSRLVGFYEAAHLSAPAAAATADLGDEEDGSTLIRQTGVTPASPSFSDSAQRSCLSKSLHTSDCRSVSCAMRLGKLAIVGAEARILGEVVLIDACLELHERMQEWKMAMDESLETVEEQYDATICHSLDRLAKLIGLLQYDGYAGDHW